MHFRPIPAAACLSILGALATASDQPSGEVGRRHNPIVELLAQKKPVFGLYAPSNRRVSAPGVPALSPVPPRTPLELAREAVAQKAADYIFDGSMEGDFEGALPAFAEFAKGMSAAGVLAVKPVLRLTHPLVVKMNEITPDPVKAAERIGRQLDLGVSGIVFVDVRSAGELKAGLAAMRFKSRGGTRAESVGKAPAFWGMSEKEYRESADVWPLNPKGELVNFTIVESRQGLAKVREIAAVPGIGVLFPGAGTLRSVFTSKNDKGEPVVDTAAWEAAIQSVLAACREFNVPCGYPARSTDIEMRMKQGFSVFVIGWGEDGFKTIDIGRRVSGRAATNP